MTAIAIAAAYTMFLVGLLLGEFCPRWTSLLAWVGCAISVALVLWV